MNVNLRLTGKEPVELLERLHAIQKQKNVNINVQLDGSPQSLALLEDLARHAPADTSKQKRHADPIGLVVNAGLDWLNSLVAQAVAAKVKPRVKPASTM